MAKVLSMHLGLKISGMELAFPLAWQHRYSINSTHWRTGAIKWKAPHAVLLCLHLNSYIFYQILDIACLHTVLLYCKFDNLKLLQL